MTNNVTELSIGETIQLYANRRECLKAAGRMCYRCELLVFVDAADAAAASNSLGQRSGSGVPFVPHINGIGLVDERGALCAACVEERRKVDEETTVIV